MAEDRAALKVTNDLKASISAVLQGYGDGRGPVTDASAELHRLCGCLELLLQFDQKAQRSFLGARRDYWDFLSAALRQQRGDTEKVHFVCSQDKLKTPLGKGRAFIRLCLARGQLAESLQLCLLSPELTREWYGPRSPLLCPELREDILDCLYALNGVTFDLDLQQPDLDGAWPMFSESRCSSASQTQGRRPRKIKGSPKEGSAALGWNPLRERPEGLHTSRGSCLQDALREDPLPGLPSSPQPKHLPAFLEKKGEDSSCPQKTWELEGKELHISQEDETPKTGRFRENSVVNIQPRRGKAKDAQKEGLETKEGATTTEKPQEPTQVTSKTTQEDPAEVALQEVVKGLRKQLQQAKEQAQGREQLLRVQEGELQALREQLSRCQKEKARLQAELEQKQQEAERRDAMYEGELAGQRDLVQAMKRRVLELIRVLGVKNSHSCWLGELSTTELHSRHLVVFNAWNHSEDNLNYRNSERYHLTILNIKKTRIECSMSQAWWRTPLIPALGRQRLSALPASSPIPRPFLPCIPAPISLHLCMRISVPPFNALPVWLGLCGFLFLGSVPLSVHLPFSLRVGGCLPFCPVHQREGQPVAEAPAAVRLGPWTLRGLQQDLWKAVSEVSMQALRRPGLPCLLG